MTYFGIHGFVRVISIGQHYLHLQIENDLF